MSEMTPTEDAAAEPEATAVMDAPEASPEVSPGEAETAEMAKADLPDLDSAEPEADETPAAETPAPAPEPEPEDDEPEDDGFDEPMQYYVLKVASNRETTIKRVLERDIKRDAMDDYFGEVLIPTEKVKETKNGKTRVKNVKLWPGYLVVQMRATDEARLLVRGISGVGDFTGMTGTGVDRKPVPMTDEEVARLKGEETKKEEAAEKGEETVVVKVPFDEGSRVKVKEGAFENFEGTVEQIDQHTGKIKILVEIFGRPTEMELEHWQVEKL